nr:hypothetical protein [uncultured Pseudomonas sp.]
MGLVFKLEGLSERENLIAQLVACVVLEGQDSGVFGETRDALKLPANCVGDIEKALSKLENHLASTDDSLSDLLANASKSTCCS